MQDTTPNAAAPEHTEAIKGFTPNTKEQFDPLTSKDWMMSFDSPRSNNQNSRLTMGPYVPSLLDTLEPIASPRSIVKYTQRDMDIVKDAMTVEYENQISKLRQENSITLKKFNASELEKQKLKDTLMDWEKAVKAMVTIANQVQEREKERQEFEKREQQLSTVHKTLLQSKEVCLKEMLEYKQNFEHSQNELNDCKQVSLINSCKITILPALKSYKTN